MGTFNYIDKKEFKMKEKIKMFFERNEEQYLEEVEDCIISSNPASIYINVGNGSYSYKLEKIYEYCFQCGYSNIVIYGDYEVFEETHDQYYELLDAIAEGAIDKIIFYSIDDIPEDVYKLLYNCRNTSTKIELVTFDDSEDYPQYNMDVLKYIAYYE